MYNISMSEEKTNQSKPVKVKKVKTVRVNGPVSRFLTKIIIILILILGIMGFAYFGWKKNQNPEVTKSYVLVKESLTYWQEFVTLKYRYSDIVSIKKEGFISKSYALVKYSGIVRAGIPDLTQCDIKVSSDGKSLTITLPEAEILGNEIESEQVFDEQHSIFVPLKMDEVFAEIENSKDIALAELLDDGLLNDARDYAKKILTQIFLTAGFESVEVN